MVQVEEAKEKNAGLAAQKEDLNGKQIRLNAKLDELTSENRFFHHWVWESLAANRNLKSSLLEAERYREEYREVAEILALLKVIKKTSKDVDYYFAAFLALLEVERIGKVGLLWFLKIHLFRGKRTRWPQRSRKPRRTFKEQEWRERCRRPRNMHQSSTKTQRWDTWT